MQPQPVTTAEIAAPQEPTATPALRAADDEEPNVDVRAGLLGDAIELLELCDELINHPGHDRIDARLRQLSVPPRHSVTGVRWPHEALAATASELQSILADAGIIVEPTLRGRRRRHHRA
jgi:hypothetical protein